MVQENLTPEAIEQLRAYGAALQGIPGSKPTGDNPFMSASPWRILLGALQGVQSRSALDTAERARFSQRQNLFRPVAPSSAAAPGGIETGSIPPRAAAAPSSFGSTEVRGAHGTPLTEITSRSGARFTVASEHADRFNALISDLEAAGYHIDPRQSGGYNPRNIAGTSTPSQHSFGRAIDINTQLNARGTRGNIDPRIARELAQRHGFVWGGDWRNPDPMHFEVATALPVRRRAFTAGHPGAMPDIIRPEFRQMNLGGPRVEESTLPPVNPAQRFSPQANRTPIPAGALEGRVPAVVDTGTQPQRTAQAPPVAPTGSQAQGPRQLPAGVMPNIVPDPNIANLERQLNLAGTMTPDEARKVYDQYLSLVGPQARETAAGTAYYHGGTGAFMYLVPKLIQRPISAGGVTTQEQMLMQPGGLGVIPTGPLNQQPGAGNGTGAPATGERTTYGNPRDLPQSGRFGDYAQFGQEVDTARRFAETQTGNISTAATAGASAARQINLLDSLLSASRRGGFVRGQPVAEYVQLARTVISNINPILPEFLKVNTQGLSNADVINKLQGQLAFLASSAMSNRGTNLDLNTAMSTVPGLGNSAESIEFLVHILKQEAQAQVRLARKAQELQANPSRIGEWPRIQLEEWENHPLSLRMPNGQIVTPVNVNTPDEARRLPSGTWVITPQGRLDQTR